MPIQIIMTKGKVPVKIYTDVVEENAKIQLSQLANLSFIHPHIAVMPDVHAGKGATIGSVIPMQHAIVPAAVGVDIGCGMNAVRLSLNATQLPDNLKNIRKAIEAKIPVGFNQHKQLQTKASSINDLQVRLKKIVAKHQGISKMLRNFNTTWGYQLGTLGGGNHFIEMCIDENNAVWLMLHSGSRGIGNVMGQYFILLAQKKMGRLAANLPHKDLAYFKDDSPFFDDYIEAVYWAQDYALQNRREMMRLLIDAIKPSLPHFKVTKEAINCHHNYVQLETHYGQDVYLTRKGAISAKLDELGIIPGSMGAKSFIVRGKGNRSSFHSCSHGAGRIMSRGKAKRTFTQQHLQAQTTGVECRKDNSVIDEIPGAYKDIDTVMSHQHDLVDIVHTLKQVICVKG